MTAFPAHLSEFIVDQHYDRYTPINQAVWRYVMRQNFAYFREKGHPSYVQGLEASGISIDRIPDVAHMNECLHRFGWSAVTIDGLIPSTVFMDFQAHGILPISADIRTLDHLAYTPAPDILHETAGHAPILVDEKFTTFVKRFGQLGAKIFSSKEDHEIYELTRLLAILKESPTATPDEVQEVEDQLKAMEAAPRDPSEYTLVSRLYWWTVEYGLIGDLQDPKIYGAGLLSSVGESKLCYEPHIKKLPFSLQACIDTAFDITTYQPQLFVCESFDQLIAAVEELESRMAYKLGGTEALRRAARSGHTATAVYSSGLQVSGTIRGFEVDAQGEAVFLRTDGPTVLAVENQELVGHGQDYHRTGYGAPIGKLRGEATPIEDFSEEDLKRHNLEAGRFCHLTFESGVEVKGAVAYVRRHADKVFLIGFESCTVTFDGRTLHKSFSDVYHMAVGARIVSAFAGAADKEAFHEQIYRPSETSTPVHEIPASGALLNQLYLTVRELRETAPAAEVVASGVQDVVTALDAEYPKDWLLRLEAIELLSARRVAPELQARLLDQLQRLQADGEVASLIRNGLALLDTSHLQPASQA